MRAAGSTFGPFFKRMMKALWMLACLAATPGFLTPGFAAESRTIAVIGTGKMGAALGGQLAKAGHRVVYGSREPSSEKVATLLAAIGPTATATTQADAARESDLIILAVPWTAMEGTISNLGNLDGKILVDIATADRQAADGYPELSVQSSTSEMIQAWAPGARVVKTAFSAAQVIENPARYPEATITYIAADDRAAKERVAALAIQLHLFPLDAGPLRMAKSIDHMGLLYLTPLIQGRGTTWTSVPRVAADYSCIPTRGWFRSVKDADNLATFPNLQAVKAECP